MLRNRAVALILGFVASPLVVALGLGPIQSDSFLNEPFTGRIELLGATAGDFDTLNIRLASSDQFKRAGIELNPLLYKLKFGVDTGGAKDFITVTSKEPVREPFLNFLVELNWANGRLLREYTVLLDPPLYDAKRRQAPTRPAKPKLAPVATTPSVAPAPSSVAPAAPAAAPYSGGDQIGPIVATDTLWSIASNVRPDASVTVQQMMLALLRENPDAFGQNNINLLRRGAILRMPDSGAMAALSAADALAEVRRQHQLWEEYRGGIAATPASQPVGAPAPSDNVDSTPAPTADSRLELVAPGGDTGSGGAGAAAGGGDDLLREEIDARAQQAADLSGKLTEAEEIIDLLQRQVNIKDDELAALQARLAELGIEDVDIEGLRAKAAAAAGEESGEVAADDADDLDMADDADTDDGGAMDDDSVDMADEEAMDDAADMDDDADMADDDDMADDTDAAADVADSGDAGVAVADGGDQLGFPYSLIPASIAELVPGGALTVLAAIAAAILGLFATIIAFLTRSRDTDSAVSAAAAAPAVAAAADVEADATEDPTITASTDLPDDDSEAVTEIGATDGASEEAFDPNATVEAAAEDHTATAEMAAAQVEPEEDPLEEINVYLAYERFDQAEELVKRVIGEYPDRHEYKLRLLEVYYSSNDRASYEAEARNLFDAVGESDPLWDSAVAMWTEMSPDRVLFAEGGEAAADAAPADTSAFVDITGDAGDEPAPGEDTVAHAPGGDGGLDFDLAADDGTSDDGVLDLTASADDADDVLDLTAAADADDDALDLTAADDGVLDITGADDDVLDLTASADDELVLDLGGDDDDVLDLTAGGDDDVLDISAGGEDSILDISSDGAAESAVGDLLDVTKTGDIAGVDDVDLLNVTSPGLMDDDTAAPVGDDDDDGGLDITDISGAAEEALDFDISDTVAPAFDEVAGAGDEILDLTGGGSGDAGDELLDFDIGGLEDDGELDTEATTVLDDPGLPDSGQMDADTVDLDIAAGGSDDELDLDITMDAAQLTGGLEITETEDDEGGLEITMGSDGDGLGEGISLQGDDLGIAGEDDDFDFALDGTTEMDSIAADDTLDMGAVSTAGEESLDDLSQQLDGALDDLEIEGFDPPTSETDLLDTVALDDGEIPTIELDEEKTVVMPMADDVERQSDADEADTKLNLAKAYIELGDNEGARSILNEVATEGSDVQKAEAQDLLSQLPG